MQKFTCNDEYFCQFGNEGYPNGHLNCPLGITVHNNSVYVANQVNHCISVFHCDGKFSHIIGSNQLSTATFGVAISDRNQLFVADFDNYCIFTFTLDGVYVGKIGTEGSDKGQLNHPSGIAVDKDGYILITEPGNFRVSIFNKDGIFMHCFSSKGSTEGQFNTHESLGIAVSPDGNIYISDYANMRIQIYSDFCSSY